LLLLATTLPKSYSTISLPKAQHSPTLCRFPTQSPANTNLLSAEISGDLITSDAFGLEYSQRCTVINSGFTTPSFEQYIGKTYFKNFACTSSFVNSKFSYVHFYVKYTAQFSTSQSLSCSNFLFCFTAYLMGESLFLNSITSESLYSPKSCPFFVLTSTIQCAL
jgi:hypothetical protein